MSFQLFQSFFVYLLALLSVGYPVANAGLRAQAENREIFKKWEQYFSSREISDDLRPRLVNLAESFLKNESEQPIEGLKKRHKISLRRRNHKEVESDERVRTLSIPNEPEFREEALQFVFNQGCPVAMSEGDQVVELLSFPVRDRKWQPFRSMIQEVMLDQQVMRDERGLCPEYYKSLMEAVFLSDDPGLQKTALEALRNYKGPYLFDIYLSAIRNSPFNLIRVGALENGVADIELAETEQKQNQTPEILQLLQIEVQSLQQKVKEVEDTRHSRFRSELNRLIRIKLQSIKRAEAAQVDQVMIGELFFTALSDLSPHSARVRLAAVKNAFFQRFLLQFHHAGSFERFVRDYQHKETDKKVVRAFFETRNLDGVTLRRILHQYYAILTVSDNREMRTNFAKSSTFSYLIQRHAAFRMYFIRNYLPNESDPVLKESFLKVFTDSISEGSSPRSERFESLTNSNPLGMAPDA